MKSSNKKSKDESNTKSKVQPCLSSMKKSAKTSDSSSEFIAAQFQSSNGDKQTFKSASTSSNYDFKASQSKDGNKQPVVIGYVHNLSPTKRNRGNTLSYCSLTLQTSTSQSREALLYSPAKRTLLEQSQTSHTPVKILNFTHTDDKEKLVINDMTNITTPEKHEYNFQYGQIAAHQLQPTTILQILNSNKEWDTVALRAKVLSVKPIRTVGTKKRLNLMEAVIGDETGTISLDVWEASIKEINAGQVYLLDRVQVRVWASKKKLSTIYPTRISVIEESPLEDLNHDATQELKQTIDVNRIKRVPNVDRFLKCAQCSKRILQGSVTGIVRCDKCNCMMRAPECQKSLTVKIVILKPDGDELSITINDNVLSDFFKESVIDMDHDSFDKRLFDMENIIITYEPETLHCIKIEKK